MKNKIILFLIIIIAGFPCSGLELDNGEPIQRPEQIIPGNAVLYLEINPVLQAIDLINSDNELSRIIDNLYDLTSIRQLKDNHNIDILNPVLLRQFGIDVDKPLYAAFIPVPPDKYEIIYFIPLINPVQIQTAINLITAQLSGVKDINFTKINYNDFIIYGANNNLYYSLIDNFLAFTRTEKTMTGVIDLKNKIIESGLSNDPVYSDYRKKNSENNFFVSAFIKNSFLDYFLKKLPEKSVPDNQSVTNQITMTENNITNTDNSEGTPDNSNNKQFDRNNFSGYQFINYASLGLNVTENDLQFNLSLSLNRNENQGKFFLNLLNTGLLEQSAYAERITGYHFLSVNAKKLFDQCNSMGNNSFCDATDRLLNDLARNNLNLRPVLTCSDKYINFIFQKPKVPGEPDSFLLLLPLDNCESVDGMFKTLKNDIRRRYGRNKKYGEEKNDGYQYFWYKDEKFNKINILLHKKTIYAGNNIQDITDLIKNSDKKFNNIKKGFAKLPDNNTFFRSYTEFDDDSFFKAVLMMMAFNKNPELYNIISRIRSVYINGTCIDDEIKLNSEIKLLPVNKKIN